MRRQIADFSPDLHLLLSLKKPWKNPLYSFRPVGVMYAARGEVTERPMVLAWKAGVVNATGGSNPPLSAIFYLADEKRPSAALLSSPIDDVPGGTPYSVGFQAPSI
jgi:hypothetical protein